MRCVGPFVTRFSHWPLRLVVGAQPVPGLTDGAREGATCGQGLWADSFSLTPQRPDECRAVPAAPLAHQPGRESQTLQPPPQVPGVAQEIRHATALEGVQGWEGMGLRSPCCAAWEGLRIPRQFPPGCIPRVYFRGSGQNVPGWVPEPALGAPLGATKRSAVGLTPLFFSSAEKLHWGVCRQPLQEDHQLGLADGAGCLITGVG